MRISTSRSTACRSRSASRGSIGRAEDQAAVERLEERQPGLERQRDRLAAGRAAQVQGARRPHRTEQQLAVRDLLAARGDRDALGAAPGGAREPMAEVHPHKG
jgi:hypothetical protein